MTKLSRNITSGKDYQERLYKGILKTYKVAKSCYGPTSGNAAIELNYGPPQISHDGVTNIRKVYLEDPISNMAARLLVQASEQSNRIVGDGTTAAVILAFHLYKEALSMIGSGKNRMEVSRELKTLAGELVSQVDKMKIKTTPQLSRFVAKVSAGDEAIGEMVADVIDRVGIEGNIIVEEFDGVGSFDEEVQGFYFRKGFSHQFLINNLTSLESKMSDVDIFITDKKLETQADINLILSKIIESGGRGVEILIVGEVDGDALATLALNKVHGNIITTLVDVPVYGPMRTLFLEDLAVYTGGKVFPTGAKASSFSIDMLGSAEKVVVNSFSTTIIRGEGAEEDIKVRLRGLREQLRTADNLVDREEIRKRLSTLQGKISIIHVGAPTEADRGEIQLRVEDAIAATQSAIKDGIVPGCGVCLARLQTEHKAFKEPLRTLVKNAGYNPDQALFKVLESKDLWSGYDLKQDDFNYKPVNLLKAGIIDPAEVAKETIRNACSVVSTLITNTIGITFKDREVKSD